MTVELTIDDKINGYKGPIQEKIDDQPEEVESLSSDEAEKDKLKVDGQEEVSREKEAKEPEDTQKSETEVSNKESDVDEYGNEVAKSRMYTEEEVQQKIRERLSRGHLAQQNQQAQVQQATQDFQADPESSESWEAQLESFVKNTIDKVGREAQQKEWQHKEQVRQVEFETKFTNGMEKYKDFREVVAVLPITDSIMMATREMKDPAAFLYAAAKTHPKEIERIASLQDPFHQATEIGRLEERMKKAKNISNSARPLANTKSDFSSEKVTPKRSIDDLINKHAKGKLRR